MFKTVRLGHLRAGMLAAGMLAAAGLLVVVLYARPAEANYPGKPGKIAYASKDATDREIYTINPDGGGQAPGHRQRYGRLVSCLLAQRPKDSLRGLRRARRRDLHH